MSHHARFKSVGIIGGRKKVAAEYCYTVHSPLFPRILIQMIVECADRILRELDASINSTPPLRASLPFSFVCLNREAVNSLEYYIANHKKYNFLDCDWLKNFVIG